LSEKELDKGELRILAKKRLGQRIAKDVAAEERIELIEELNIHQEELLIQNEELKKVQLELESSRALFFELYDLAPIGYLSLTPELFVKETNLAATSLLGTERERVIGKALSSFISPRSHEALYIHYRHVAQGMEREKHVFSIKRRDGKNLQVQFESNLVREPKGGFRSVLTDVTEIMTREMLANELDGINKQIGSSLDFDQIMKIVVKSASSAMGGAGTSIAMRDGGNWIISYKHNLPAEMIHLRLDDTTAKLQTLTAEKKELVFVRDAQSDPRNSNEMAIKYGLKSVMTAPLIVNGEVIGTLGFSFFDRARDMTPTEIDFTRKLAASLSMAIQNSRLFESVSEKEARYRSMFYDNKASMLLIDPLNEDIVDANPAACEYYGYTCEILRKMKFHDLNVLDSHIVKLEMSKSLTGEKKKFDFQHILASGEIRDVEAYSGPINVCGRELIFSIIHDVTDRKSAEESLRKSEAKYRGLFQNVQEVAVIYEHVYDDSGRLIDARLLEANPYWLKATGTELQEVQGKLLSSLFDQPYFEKSMQIFRQLKKTGEPIVLERPFPPNGSERRSSFFLIDDDHTVITGIDISHIRRAQQAAEEYSTRLERSNAELMQFAYFASHDLKEPLRMITSYLLLLKTRYRDKLDPDAQEFIDFAVDGGKRMDELINDLLEYSKVDSKGRAFADVDMNEVLETTLNILKVSIYERAAEIIFSDLPTVTADHKQMVLLMQNLVGNAIKFHGVERPTVHISSSFDGSEWTIAVKDNGIGLNMDNASKIFLMFHRLHTREEYPGTGIGLAIAKKIVEHHGGCIWVESEEGKGATFFFTIPKDH